ADRDLREVAQAEDHDEQRIERVHRHRVVGGEEGIAYAPRRRPALQQRAERYAGDHGGGDRNADVEERGGDVVRELAGGEDTPERLRHRGGRDYREAGDDVQPAEDLQEENRGRDQRHPGQGNPAHARPKARIDSPRNNVQMRLVRRPKDSVATRVESRSRGQPVAITSRKRPGRADMTPTRSASIVASSSAWVMRTTVAPVSRHSRR